MKQLIIHPEKCYGCRSCELACSYGHFGEFNPKLANVHVFEYEKAAIAIPVMCLQCEEAVCMKVCPVHAISRNENNAFKIDYRKCIGCKMCANACPLGNISYHPLVAKVFKCDLCDGDPKCATFCPGHAIEYVDTDAIAEKRAMVSEKYKDFLGEEEAK